MAAYTLIKAISSEKDGDPTAVIVEEVTFESKAEAKAAQAEWEAPGFPRTSLVCPRLAHPKSDARMIEQFRSEIRGDAHAV